MDKEHELLALKARKARILNGLPEPKKLVWNEENAETIKELCEVESRIAQLEGRNPLEIYKIVPDSDQPDDAEHTFYYPSDRIDYTGQIRDLDTRREELETMANDRDALRELMVREGTLGVHPSQTGCTQDNVEHPSHYTSGGIECICTNEQPGPVTSTWPLVWNGLVQIDDDKLIFEFVERKDTDDKV